MMKGYVIKRDSPIVACMQLQSKAQKDQVPSRTLPSRSAMVRTVMIVDDNPHVREVLCQLFARQGDFDVCGEAENGREAVEKAQQLHPDLIVTDLSMPVMNGLEEARLLKNLMPAVLVIIYTAHSDSFVQKEARSAGASAVISKSEAVAVLIGKARSLLDQRAA